MGSRNSLKNVLNVFIKEEDEEEDESSIDEVSNSNVITISSNPTYYEQFNDDKGETQVYDIPETKSLLPPLPDESTHTTPKFDLHEFDTTFSNASTPQKSRSRTNSFKISNTTIPNAQLLRTPPTPASTFPDHHRQESHNSIEVVRTPNTPTSTSNIDDALIGKSLNYSPVISTTTNSKFEVSLIEMSIDNDNLQNDEEKLKLYLNLQKLERNEFDKTLKSFQKSGWMSRNELYQLELAKLNNFNNWESKINELKRNLGKKNMTSDFNDHVTTPPVVDDYFNRPKATPHNTTDEGNIPNGTNNTTTTNNNLNKRSPSVLSLGQRFSAFGIK